MRVFFIQRLYEQTKPIIFHGNERYIWIARMETRAFGCCHIVAFPSIMYQNARCVRAQISWTVRTSVEYIGYIFRMGKKWYIAKRITYNTGRLLTILGKRALWKQPQTDNIHKMLVTALLRLQNIDLCTCKYRIDSSQSRKDVRQKLQAEFYEKYLYHDY